MYIDQIISLFSTASLSSSPSIVIVLFYFFGKCGECVFGLARWSSSRVLLLLIVVCWVDKKGRAAQPRKERTLFIDSDIIVVLSLNYVSHEAPDMYRITWRHDIESDYCDYPDHLLQYRHISKH